VGVLNQILKRPLAAVVPLCLLFGFFGAAVAAEKTLSKSFEVKITDDLYKDAQLAKKKRVPLVVLFSQDGCFYCTFVRENFLKPMLISGDYENKAVIRELKVDSFEDIRNFDGKMIPADELSTFYRAFVTPTVIVLDSNGKAHYRMIGMANEHYYSGELDAAIDETYGNIHRVAAN